jgi:hypothetical protein
MGGTLAGVMLYAMQKNGILAQLINGLGRKND